ncbi:uncharacterized protein LOC108667179 [Hyalella azteca]|uniref:Uncharacterized protein LOC108667179 n=1 Tax=Hyalella azteca TaxID=294128 RepID=A0A8B7N8P5_HYAAZ|nr:uncharacterized protein LOC108667179 [Hyalella azteca]
MDGRSMAVNSVALLALLLRIATVAGQGEREVLPCYTCTYIEGGDDSCYKDPDNSGSVPITDCKRGKGQCCIISRTDATDKLGTPKSLYRGCVENCDPKKIGKMEVTPSFSDTNYKTYCKDPRCNNGPGNVKPGTGGGGGKFIDGIEGINSAFSHHAVWGLVVLLLFGIYQAYNYH